MVTARKRCSKICKWVEPITGKPTFRKKRDVLLSVWQETYSGSCLQLPVTALKVGFPVIGSSHLQILLHRLRAVLVVEPDDALLSAVMLFGV